MQREQFYIYFQYLLHPQQPGRSAHLGEIRIHLLVQLLRCPGLVVAPAAPTATTCTTTLAAAASATTASSSASCRLAHRSPALTTASASALSPSALSARHHPQQVRLGVNQHARAISRVLIAEV